LKSPTLSPKVDVDSSDTLAQVQDEVVNVANDDEAVAVEEVGKK
jgi:hypothetical protein